jgi:hypothetical protein
MSINTSITHQAEAALQSEFVAAIFKQRNMISIYNPQGLNIYQRAMAQLFPSIHAFLDEDDFSQLVQLYWREIPPQRGDWGQYGSDFAEWLATNNPGGIVTALPYLPDLARLDLALSHCQNDTDATTDLSTLALLAGDSNKLKLILHPSVAILTLDYLVLPFQQAALTAENFITPINQRNIVLIYRHGWRPIACNITSATAICVKNCLAGTTIMYAYETACATDATFDFATLLTQAIEQNWLSHVAFSE